MRNTTMEVMQIYSMGIKSGVIDFNDANNQLQQMGINNYKFSKNGDIIMVNGIITGNITNNINPNTAIGTSVGIAVGVDDYAKDGNAEVIENESHETRIDKDTQETLTKMEAIKNMEAPKDREMSDSEHKKLEELNKFFKCECNHIDDYGEEDLKFYNSKKSELEKITKKDKKLFGLNMQF